MTIMKKLSVFIATVALAGLGMGGPAHAESVPLPDGLVSVPMDNSDLAKVGVHCSDQSPYCSGPVTSSPSGTSAIHAQGEQSQKDNTPIGAIR
ncbi:hypothetical protein [Kitasatospora purpeofusca]|uniref:hypothetical protein n=1 Tax=Kitasatospora purpeofusca TaxID=67352 RepID=UPI0036679F87